MQSYAIFSVVLINVSFQGMIRYLRGFILHQVEIQHTNNQLRNTLHKIIEIFKLFLLLHKKWNRLYGIKAFFQESFYFLKKDHLNKECCIQGTLYPCPLVNCPPSPKRKRHQNCQQNPNLSIYRTIQLIGIYSGHATTNTHEISHFTRIPLSCLWNGSAPDVQPLCSLVGKNPSRGSFFLKSHVQLCV